MTQVPADEHDMPVSIEGKIKSHLRCQETRLATADDLETSHSFVVTKWIPFWTEWAKRKYANTNQDGGIKSTLDIIAIS